VLFGWLAGSFKNTKNHPLALYVAVNRPASSDENPLLTFTAKKWRLGKKETISKGNEFQA
jgi:hypothetical protein